MRFSYKCWHFLFHTLYTKLLLAKGFQPENVPLEGGVILAPNHLSNWDPMLVSCFLKREVGYMAKEELFRVPLLGPFLRYYNSFPVRRFGLDRTAIRLAINKLKSGECVGIFPEGHRSPDGNLQKGSPGVALIAAKAQVPIVPIAIINTNNVSAHFPPNIKVLYGKPIPPPPLHMDKNTANLFTQNIMQEIQNLLNELKKY